MLKKIAFWAVVTGIIGFIWHAARIRTLEDERRGHVVRMLLQHVQQNPSMCRPPGRVGIFVEGIRAEVQCILTLKDSEKPVTTGNILSLTVLFYWNQEDQSFARNPAGVAVWADGKIYAMGRFPSGE